MFKHWKKWFLLCGIMLALCIFTACGTEETPETQTADLVLKSSNIYTVASEEALAGGIAIAGDKILAVGTEEEIAPYIGEATEVRDMGEQLIMPGLIDGHTHSRVHWGSVGVDLTNVTSQEECAQMVKQYREEHPDAEFIVGAGWYRANWGGDPPTKEVLDAVVSDIPVYLKDFDGHGGWFNSKALELHGVTKETAQALSVGGEVVVDPTTGEPTGWIKENPAFDIFNEVPPFDDIEDLKTAIYEWQRYGVTSINDMGSNVSDSVLLNQLKQLEESGELNVRHFMSFDMNDSVEDIERGKELYNSDVLRLNALKVFADGVGSSGTAAMLQPYKDTDNMGELLVTEEELVEGFTKAAELGLASHIHTCGDKAVQTALNAYETVIANGVEIDPRSSVEHCDTTAPEDIPRFAELGLNVNLTPDFMAPTLKWEDNPYMQVYDEETQKELWNIGSIYRTGANVTFGTDTYWSSFNPMVQIYRSIARVSNDGNPVGGYLPEEAITVKDAIQCYTINSAKGIGMEDKLGTLEAGKYADIVVLDTNILTCPTEDIFNAAPVLTMMGGKITYEK